MKQWHNAGIALVIFALASFSQQRGVVDRDITFTTYKGQTGNLHDLLNSGKHVYVLTFKYPG